MNKPFQCPESWLDHKIDIILVGAGGSGSNALDALSQLHHGLLAVGHQHGLNVTVFDDDVVDVPNIGRQRFTMADVGNNKAIILVNRYNLAYGLNWTAHPIRFEGEVMQEACPDLLITCVDTVSTRADIAQTLCVSRDDDVAWMDFGNGRHTGQCIIGELNNHSDRLPNVFDLYPELQDMEEDSEPSCSLAEAIKSQDLFINRTIVDAGINILWQLLRNGSIDHHGVFINQQTSEVKPLKINTDVWQFMGYEATA